MGKTHALFFDRRLVGVDYTLRARISQSGIGRSDGLLTN